MLLPSEAREADRNTVCSLIASFQSSSRLRLFTQPRRSRIRNMYVYTWHILACDAICRRLHEVEGYPKLVPYDIRLALALFLYPTVTFLLKSWVDDRIKKLKPNVESAMTLSEQTITPLISSYSLRIRAYKTVSVLA